jgi:2-(1,2-epoxy-1,2-dihydrophenyl)acetyl-CoA isomerase
MSQQNDVAKAARTIETDTDHLLARVEDGVAILTMNRPERRNALSDDMIAAMEAALREAESARDVRCVVLTGAGGAFCAGGDVKGMNERNREPGEPRARTSLDEAIARQRLAQRATAGKLYEMPKPTIAALPGAAAGAGLSLALACDLRIASENAVMVTSFARVGFSGDFGGTFFLTQLVGSARARELYYLSERIDARAAERLGLVNRVVPHDALEQESLALARRLASGPSVAYRYMKENLNRAVGGELGECLDLEATHHIHTGLTEDHKNAARAFVEKRTPVFEGR